MSSAIVPLVHHSFERRGVGADVGLGERERRHRAFGEPGEVLLLLLVGTEHLERLRHPDRLVRGQ